MLGFLALFVFAVVGLAVPEVAFELAIVECSLIHQLNTLLGMQPTSELDFANSVGVVREKVNFVDRTNLRLNFSLQFGIYLLEELSPRHLLALFVILVELRHQLLDFVKRVKALEDYNFQAHFVQFVLVPRHLSLVFGFDAHFLYFVKFVRLFRHVGLTLLLKDSRFDTDFEARTDL